MDHGHGTRDAAPNGGPRGSRTASTRETEPSYALHQPREEKGGGRGPVAANEANASDISIAADYGLAATLDLEAPHSDPFPGSWLRARRLAGIGGTALGQGSRVESHFHPIDAFLDSDSANVEPLFNPLVNRALKSADWAEAEHKLDAIDHFLDETDPADNPVDRREIWHVASMYLEGPPPKPKRTLGMFYPWQAHDESVAFRRRLQRLCGSMMLENHQAASRDDS